MCCTLLVFDSLPLIFSLFCLYFLLFFYSLFFCFSFLFFFFSSRRRHTRLVSDWSSDVCSSDLLLAERLDLAPGPHVEEALPGNEIQPLGQQVGLGHRGVPVRPEVGPDHANLELPGGVGNGPTVPLGEVLRRVPFILAWSHPASPWIEPGESRTCGAPRRDPTPR